MKAIDALKEVANSSGIPVAHIGLKLGRRPNYVSGIAHAAALHKPTRSRQC